ncbi:MAG: ribosome-associated translation inhibitor RaiA [Rhodospirillales bacterium]|nr:ribosome-associated translation inhibitor RaiA [Rhodospirillales bacterium]
MEISVKGKQIDIGAALQSHVTDHLNASVLKYFERALDANVILSKESHAFRADISVHPSRGMTVQGKAVADDAYAAFDSALARIAKQLRRYKRRLQDHHKGRPEEDFLTAQYSILASDDTEDELPVDGEPAIIADMPHEIATLTVGEAVMRLDLADAPAMMFKNSANGSFNVVYRRADGNIGWIDPSNTQNV